MTAAPPTTAERVRSACARAASSTLAIAGADVVGTSLHHLFDDGTFAVAVPADSATAATVVSAGPNGMPALLELTDQAPLPLREPVRSLVWVRGNVVAATDREARGIVDVIASRTPDPALLDIRTDMRLRTEPGSILLCLTVESVVVADSTGAESVDVSALLGARPDPFCALEAGWLSHIDNDHHDLVERLARRLPLSLQHGEVRLLGIDRYGIQLRVEGEAGDHDVRLPFNEPVNDTAGLSQALRILAGCPFLNGLRARKI
ncbi:DUF2470 domain-containing protein [Mycobacteroides chelonae]